MAALGLLLVAPTLVAQPASVASTAGVSLPPPPVGGDPFVLPRAHHPWARHEVGAYRTLREVTETFDEAGRFVARTESEQTDRLVAVTSESYTLQTTVTIQVGPVRAPSQTQACTYRLLTDSASVTTSQVELEPAELTIDGRVIRCQRIRLSTEAGQRTGTETVWYSPDLPPHVLRRERTVSETPGAEPTESIESVTDLQMPMLDNDGVVGTHHVRYESQRPGGSTFRTEVRGDAVPGALLTASSVERGPEGRRVRWSATELVDYGKDGKSEIRPRRWRLFRRPAE